MIKYCLHIILKVSSSASNVFHNSHLIQKCIQNQQLLLILYTLLNQMRVGKNIRQKDDRITSLYQIWKKIFFGVTNPVFPGRTTTDTMGEVAVGGEAGWREERAVMALSSFMFQMDKKTRFFLRGGLGPSIFFFQI